MGQLAGVITKLQRLKAALNIRPFYIAALPTWQDHAQRIVIAVLQNSKPAETDADVWRARVEAESQRLSAMLFFSADEVGAIIGLGIRPPGTSEADPKHASVESISIDEITRWVAAGREKSDPDEPGKNLDSRDANKSDLQIAWRVLYAMKLQKPGYEGLLAAIEDFLGSAAQGAAQGVYNDILESWMEQLVPTMFDDFRDWFRRMVANSFG